MPSIRNPTRRNRNIGTTKSGQGQDNELVISQSWNDSRFFWEKLTSYQVVKRDILRTPIKILVEKTRKGYFHACTPDDITSIFEMIPEADSRELQLIVLRQPKVKEEILRPVWGRLAYYAEIDLHKGPTIFLDALDPNKSLRWSKSLSIEGSLDLARLKVDGHSIVTDKRYHRVELTIDSIRARQLYRTMFHEVGHWVDYQKSVRIPIENGGNLESLHEKYDRKLGIEKEAFANNYADELRKKLMANEMIPFDRKLDEESLRKDQLRMEDFVI